MIKWTPEQRALRDDLRRWHPKLGADHLRNDRAGVFPADTWESVSASGILRVPFEERWGGLEKDLLSTMCVLEDLGHGCRDGGLNFSVSTQMVSVGIPVQRFGSDDLKSRVLPGICSGAVLGAHAITEPEGGSDAMHMHTTATADGDAYVLNGRKAFISNGPVADVIVVYARTGEPGPFGLTAFVVERGTPGLTVHPANEKMGLRSSPYCELSFDDCRVPAGHVIGKQGIGFTVMDYVLKWEILSSFSISLGEMRHRLDKVTEFAAARRQFGQSIGSFQSVSNKIVEMKIGVETSRKWLHDTAQKFTEGESVTTDLAITKLVVSENNLASALAAVQIFGARGYTSEYGIEGDLRNAVGGTIYSGTSEVQRQRIAKMLDL
ncbi:acyl-CoA dehydrogenase family protein [Streptomyces sp. NPDC127084]|uniref:acyl-CoA dehydrogenase family protein n=1 Tax=Streptomyces sp. NPDC127084 TaxID=3347133 RepID=UPI00365B52AE